MSDSFTPRPAGRVRTPPLVKLLLFVLAALAMLSVGVSSGAALPSPCTGGTVTTQDGVLTAALVDPPDLAVPENLDASLCDIGIYYSTPGTHNLVDKNVFGARYYGILSSGAGVVTNISHSSVFDIGEKPHDGAQHGIAVAYRNGASGQLDHSQVYDYQKGGVLAKDAGTNVQILSNVIRGLGPVDFIAQNGVQLSSGAAGTVNDNFIEDHQYTGCTKADARATGCTYYVSTGILLLSVDQGLVDTKNNTYRNNDVNLYNGSNQ